MIKRFIILLVLPFLFGFKLPGGTQFEVVGEGIVQNGLRMDIQYFTHRDNPEKFAGSVLQILGNYNGEITTTLLSENTMSIGLLSDKHFINVTVKSDTRGGTEGFFTKTKLRREKVPEPPLQLPPSMKMISHMMDPVGRGRKDTWVYHSEREVVWIRNHLTQQNLQEVYTGVDGSSLYEGKAGRHRLQVTVAASNEGTGLVIVK